MSEMEAIYSRLTDRTQKMLDVALREALSLGQNYVGTEHVLLALLRDPGTLAHDSLMRFADEQTIRNEVIRLLTGGRPSAEPAEPDRSALALARGIAEKHLPDAPEDSSLPANVAEVISALALLAIAESLGGKP